MKDKIVLKVADYIVMVAMLVVPLAIGVFFAVKDAKKATRDEYLLGGRTMTMIPVMLSIFVTFQSAISLIGMPSEIYVYGPLFFGIYIGIAVSFIISYFTLTPLMYPLRITSIYEYLELRFYSKTVRLLSTITGMMQTFFYLAVALLAPGLALEEAAGIPLWISVIIVGTIGTFYTVAGGIKSVVWTDAFQTIIVFAGIFAVIGKTSYELGGIQKVWEISKAGGRTNFYNITPDIRVRHTWWGICIGGAFTWMTNLFSQSTVQRISSMKSLKDARWSMLMNVPLNLIYAWLVTMFGWCMYAYLFHIRCDPFEAGMVKNPNQMTPFFVLHLMDDLPGMSGVYMSAIFSGALSTLSSGINSLAANTVEDLLQKPLRSVTEKTATTITKLVVFFYGIGIVTLVYLAKSVKGQVTELAVTAFGTFGSTVLGMFLMGCCIPWSNKYGAAIGGITSLALNLWLIIGGMLYGRRSPTLEPVPIDQCFNSSVPIIGSFGIVNATELYTTNSHEVMSETDSLQSGFSPYDISYEWYGVIGTVTCFIVGIIVSRVTRYKVDYKTNPKLIIPFLRRYWNLYYPTERASQDVAMDIIKEKEVQAKLINS